MNDLTRGCVAEFIGTFALCFFGCGAIILTQDSIGAGSLVTVAAGFGLALAVFVTACMYVSGAQFNPAVSIALTVIGKQPVPKTAVFVFVQLFAAACACGSLVLFIGRDVADHEAVRVGASLGSLSNPENVVGLFGLEFLQTFALMFVVLGAVVDARAHKMGGICVGLVVAACIVAFGPLTGSSMNPARSFGPAIYGHWDMHWVYWAAPILGAVAAAVVYRVVWDANVETETPAQPLHEGDSMRKA
ncbi:MAG: aquaporin [Phycisphaeraceae bacterium]|nr:MAG: aquaporin [Phycisphaeraceae bacterium]